jgi:hypothetical protein
MPAPTDPRHRFMPIKNLARYVMAREQIGPPTASC